MPSSSRPKILIIYTGGTIGMIENPVTHTLQPFDFSHLIDNVPKVKKLAYDIEHLQFDPPIDSSNMNPTHWAEIALAIEKHYDAFDGFVVLHGTDTMAFTASALSFMLENLHKPVIITGSQLPIGEVRTDGEENLITALQVAAAVDAHGQAMVQEVAILFENYLWRGNRSTKMSADNFNAFRSNNYPELARIGLDITFNTEVGAYHFLFFTTDNRTDIFEFQQLYLRDFHVYLGLQQGCQSRSSIAGTDVSKLSQNIEILFGNALNRHI